jgi:hypothetical protein
MMAELIVCIAICLSDWGAAASHMSFDQLRFKPFYARKIPIWGDVWHGIAGLRYVGLGLLAWLGFGLQWEWYLITAGVNQVGWYTLKRLHGKQWGTGVWSRWFK